MGAVPGRLAPRPRCAPSTAARLRRDPAPAAAPPAVPADLGRTPSGTATTQAALGRALLDLTRAAPDAAARVVTLAPDVSSSTNLGGWVNKVGVWAARERVDWFADDPETILHWRERPTGQHLELGIAETNLVGLLGELGATWSRWGQPLLPIGVLYDPFVERALEPWSFGIYAGGQSILVGTPSGVSLAPEGGAHQSISTPSVGLEQPGCVTYEPAFAIEVEWTLLASLARLGRPDGTSAYLRLSTRPVDQTSRRCRPTRRPGSGAGARSSPGPTCCADPTPPTRSRSPRWARLCPRRWRPRTGSRTSGTPPTSSASPAPACSSTRCRRAAGGLGWTAPESWILDAAFPARRAAPMVTLLDGHPHTLAFLAGIHGVRAAHLGVTRFGQSGDLESVYRHHGIDADSVVAAALDVV